MSIEETKCCNMHTKEKEKSGTCCQGKEEEEKTECCNMHTREKEKSGTCCQTKSIHELAKENPTLTYRQVEQMKEQNE